MSMCVREENVCLVEFPVPDWVPQGKQNIFLVHAMAWHKAQAAIEHQASPWQEDFTRTSRNTFTAGERGGTASQVVCCTVHL